MLPGQGELEFIDGPDMSKLRKPVKHIRYSQIVSDIHAMPAGQEADTRTKFARLPDPGTCLDPEGFRLVGSCDASTVITFGGCDSQGPPPQFRI